MNTLEHIQSSLVALRSLRKSGQLDDPLFCKMAVSLCAELVDAGEHQEAMDVLRGLPAEYFQVDQYQQLLDDEEYCASAFTVAEALVAKGYLKATEPVAINMRRGIA